MSFDFGQDLRHALRRLRAQPATATFAVALLALAIGMSSTMFTVVDALILRPAPFRDAGSFVQLGIGASATTFNVNLPLGLIRALRAAPGFAAVHGVMQQPVTFGTGQSAQTQSGARITPGLLDDLGVNPLLGRTFVSGEGRAGTEDVGIISKVVGVTSEIRNPTLDPRSDEPEIYEPLMPAGGASAPSLKGTRVMVTVRCSSACPSLETVRERMKGASSAALVSAGKYVRDEYDSALERPRTGTIVAIAFAGIGLLAVGAGLFAVLTRVAMQRQREFGIRVALGASPADLRLLVHSSSLAIGAVGIGAGVGLAWMLGRLLAAVQYQVRLADPLTWSVVIVSIALTTVLAAWRPARQAMRADPLTLLREE